MIIKLYDDFFVNTLIPFLTAKIAEEHDFSAIPSQSYQIELEYSDTVITLPRSFVTKEEAIVELERIMQLMI
jgi:hypothetical protein